MNEPQCPAAEVQCLAFTVAMHLVFCTLMYDDNNYDSLITQTPRGLTLTIDKFVNAQKDTQKVITTRRASHQQTCALTAVECVDTNLKVNADLFIYGLKEFTGVLKRWGWVSIGDKSNRSASIVKGFAPTANFFNYEAPTVPVGARWLMQLKGFGNCVDKARALINESYVGIPYSA